MTNEEIVKINAVMKRIFIISAAVYALLIFALFYFCSGFLTPLQIILIVIFAPTVIGLTALFIYKIKRPPLPDENDEYDDISNVESSEQNE